MDNIYVQCKYDGLTNKQVWQTLIISIIMHKNTFKNKYIKKKLKQTQIRIGQTPNIPIKDNIQTN